MSTTHCGSMGEIRDWLQDMLSPGSPCFDADGVLRSYIDVTTLKPFAREWAATQTQVEPPEPYGVDYVAGVTYEDTWMAVGMYLSYLAARYRATAEPHLLDEISRNIRMAIDVYREDNPDDDVSDWIASKGFFRRLYAGRYGKWPYPETLGTDQMHPLLLGYLDARDLVDAQTRADMDLVMVGALGWYMRRNFAYIYRYISNHSIDVGPHALQYYIPALLLSYQVTGDEKFMKAYRRLHEDYVYNPDCYLSVPELPDMPPDPAPEDRHIWLHMAFGAGELVAWLADNAPNQKYYNWLLDEYIDWNTRALRNTLPGCWGRIHGTPSTKAYPDEWWDKPIEDDGARTFDGFDCYKVFGKGRRVAIGEARTQTFLHMRRSGKVDISMVPDILSKCVTTFHFTPFYDPKGEVVPQRMDFLCRALSAPHMASWLAAYWRLQPAKS